MKDENRDEATREHHYCLNKPVGRTHPLPNPRGASVTPGVTFPHAFPHSSFVRP